MNDTSPPDTLLWEALPDLTLNIAQTAALCRISVRQLGYWTRQGYVIASGRGARRTYGSEAIRRVLAIRKAMDAGASLRQSLRLVPSVLPAGEASPLAASVPPEALAGAAAPAAVLAANPLDAAASVLAHESVLRRSLIAFFAANSYTRDHAGGLAVKLGWAEDDVRVAADNLCLSGILSRDVHQEMTVFRSAVWGDA